MRALLVVLAAGWRLVTLTNVALVAVLTWTAHAHWHLADQLGAPAWLAPLLPVAIDCYVVAALRAEAAELARPRPKTTRERLAALARRRDLAWAIGLDLIAVSGSHAGEQAGLTPDQKAAVAAGLGAVLVLVLWRVHVIAPAHGPGPARERYRSGVATVTASVSDRPAAEVSPQVTPGTRPALPAEATGPDPAGVEVGTGAAGTGGGTGPVGVDTRVAWVRDQLAAEVPYMDIVRTGAARFGIAAGTMKTTIKTARAVS